MCGITRTNRQYPELKVGDEVRVIQKKDNKTKGYFPKWPKEVNKVTFITGNDYMVNDIKRKLYQRHDILKV